MCVKGMEVKGSCGGWRLRVVVGDRGIGQGQMMEVKDKVGESRYWFGIEDGGEG